MKEVSVGIVLRNGQVLTCQRHRNAIYPLKWEFPGGKIEPGETPEAALRRELREELSIEADVGRLFHTQQWTYPEGIENPERDGSFRVFYFLVEKYRGNPMNNAFETIVWVNPEELQQFDILEGNREAIALLVQHERARRTKKDTPHF
jgi:8-oxo-dGTP diphosphatase